MLFDLSTRRCPEQVARAGWTFRQLRSLSRSPIRNGIGESAQDFDLSWPRYIRITDIAGRKTLRESGKASLPPEIAASAAVCAGDLLIAAVGATFGKSYLRTQGRGRSCFAGFLVKVSPKIADVLPEFLSFWTLSTNYWDQLHAGVIQSTIQNFSAARVKRLRVPVPLVAEQAAIVKYLQHAHARIDRAIAAKRKLLALLDEQKRAVIHRAVTRGLDSTVPLRESDIPWLGQVPRHWKSVRLKYILQEVDERSATGGEQQLSVSHISGVTPRKTGVTMFKAESYLHHKVCRPGDLVANTMWLWMGAIGLSSLTGLVSPSYAVYRQLQKQRVSCDLRFLELVLRDPSCIGWFKAISTGVRSSRLRLYPEQLLAMPVPLPPLDEQRAILSVLTERAAMSPLDTRIDREITLLREFRTRLTSDVVTGQVDVREIAATLPDLTDDQLADVDEAAEPLDAAEEYLEEAPA